MTSPKSPDDAKTAPISQTHVLDPFPPLTLVFDAEIGVGVGVGEGERVEVMVGVQVGVDVNSSTIAGIGSAVELPFASDLVTERGVMPAGGTDVTGGGLLPLWDGGTPVEVIVGLAVAVNVDVGG